MLAQQFSNICSRVVIQLVRERALPTVIFSTVQFFLKILEPTQNFALAGSTWHSWRSKIYCGEAYFFEICARQLQDLQGCSSEPYYTTYSIAEI